MKTTTLIAAAVAATMAISGAAQAITFTYAQYGQTGVNGQSIKFVNNGGNSPSGTLSNNGAQQVKFKFFDDPNDLDVLPANLTTEQVADFSLTATTTMAATGNPFVQQQFDTGQIKFTGTGSLAGANLLTIDFSNMLLTGIVGSATASTIASTPWSTLTITSDFFNFSQVNSSNFSLSMSAVIPNLSYGANNVLNNFVADSSGTFASDPAPIYVPEPAMLGLFGLGAIGLGFARRRKK